jgi:hypothetical protein
MSLAATKLPFPRRLPIASLCGGTSTSAQRVCDRLHEGIRGPGIRRGKSCALQPLTTQSRHFASAQ